MWTISYSNKMGVSKKCFDFQFLHFLENLWESVGKIKTECMLDISTADTC